MLTQEQIKNLKPGDKLCADVEFIREDFDESIYVSLTGSYRNLGFGGNKVKSSAFLCRSTLSLPQPDRVIICNANQKKELQDLLKKVGSDLPETPTQYDPTRLFKKGDRVRLVERYGRNPDDGAPINVICDVEEDEYEDGTVTITYCYDHKAELFRVTALYLELVTPVEELEPYGVTDNLYGCIVFKDNPGNVVANFNNTHPHAKEAAEAERDRLNAEYRKEQNND